MGLCGYLDQKPLLKLTIMIKALIEKFLCLHQWNDKIQVKFYDPQVRETHIFICEKCGKIKKVEIY